MSFFKDKVLESLKKKYFDYVKEYTPEEKNITEKKSKDLFNFVRLPGFDDFYNLVFVDIAIKILRKLKSADNEIERAKLQGKSELLFEIIDRMDECINYKPEAEETVEEERETLDNFMDTEEGKKAAREYMKKKIGV